MKYITTFEELKKSGSNFFIHPDSNKCAGKFFIVMPAHLNMSYEKKKIGNLVYCKEVLLHNDDFRRPDYGKIWPNGDNFDIYEDNTSKLTGAYGWYYNEESFSKIDFMTPQELFDKYEKICVNLYLSVLEDSKGGYVDWYMKAIKKVKSELETISDLEYFVAANKYNL